MRATDNSPLDMAPSLKVTSQPLCDKLITLDSFNPGMDSDSSQLEMYIFLVWICLSCFHGHYLKTDSI